MQSALELKRQLTLNEAAKVLVGIGVVSGRLVDVQSLLVEGVSAGGLPTAKVVHQHDYSADLGALVPSERIDPRRTVVRREALDAWLLTLSFAPSRSASKQRTDGHVPSERAGWKVKKPKKFQGYGVAVYRALLASHAAGDCRPPTASQLLELWRDKRPADITRVLTDGVDYQSGSGERTAGLDAIGKVIARMVEPA